mmetsp:Transcript_86458/g.241959  ORF Transcript_86458/g.241959 Transcript_86458/m.241959 type:complete len:214 (+) Transcript_86458:870-1511(+)
MASLGWTVAVLAKLAADGLSTPQPLRGVVLRCASAARRRASLFSWPRPANALRWTAGVLGDGTRAPARTSPNVEKGPGQPTIRGAGVGASRTPEQRCRSRNHFPAAAPPPRLPATPSQLWPRRRYPRQRRAGHLRWAQPGPSPQSSGVPATLARGSLARILPVPPSVAGLALSRGTLSSAHPQPPQLRPQLRMESSHVQGDRSPRATNVNFPR